VANTVEKKGSNGPSTGKTRRVKERKNKYFYLATTKDIRGSTLEENNIAG